MLCRLSWLLNTSQMKHPRADLIHQPTVCEGPPWRSLKPEREGSQLPETVCREGDTTGIWEERILCVNCPNHCRIFSTPEPHLPSTNGLKSCGTRISLSQHVPEHLLLAEPHPLKSNKVTFKREWESPEHLFTNSNKISAGPALSQLK